MAVAFTSRELSQKYDRFARWYDWVEGIPELLGLGRLRQQILQQASGRVLEVAVGTGKNLRHYARDSRIIALDLSREMLNSARNLATKRPVNVSFLMADAEALPFPDNTFDSVVSSLSTCTFPDPIMALKEMARVCHPTGNILLLEHGRSDRDWLARFQDRTAEKHAKQLGCHWNRASLELVRQAGLEIKEARRVFFGIFHLVEAGPAQV